MTAETGLHDGIPATNVTALDTRWVILAQEVDYLCTSSTRGQHQSRLVMFIKCRSWVFVPIGNQNLAYV